MRLRLRPSGDSGAAIFGLVITLAVVLIAAGLLQRAASTASSINDKAKTIALTGRGINTSTDSILQLNRTNDLATSILGSAEPLEGKLGEIVALAQQVNGLAGSINGSAGNINGSAVSIGGTATSINSSARTINDVAKRINNTAGGINKEAAGILTTAMSLNRGVAQINTNLDDTIAIANLIKGDAGNILGQAVRAKDLSSDICRGVNLGGLPLVGAAAAACPTQ